MANRLGTNDPIYDLSRIGGGLNPLPGSPPDTSLEATAVGYGSATNTLTGDVANFYYNDTTKLLSVKINEYWIQETSYLVVDAGGKGDYTTIQAALNFIGATGVSGTQWAILIRNGVYQERLTLNPGVGNAYGVTFIGLGAVVIQEDASTYLISAGAYASPIEFRNITIQNTGISVAWELIGIGNGNTWTFRDCPISHTAPFFMAGNATVNFYHCQLSGGRFNVNGSATLNLYDTTLTSNGSSVVYSLGGNTWTLDGCRIINTGAGWDIEVGGGTVSVGRCLYNTANTTGTISILDGDMPGHTILAVAVKSADYTLTTSDSMLVFTASATATLPAAPPIGLTFRIACRTGTLVIDGNGSDTIKGSLTQTLGPGEDLIITYTASGIWE